VKTANITKTYKEAILKTLNRLRIVPENDDGTKCYGWKGTVKNKNILKHRINVAGNILSPRRAAWMAEHGKVPQNTYVLHSCNNVSCTNPKHLYLSNGKQAHKNRKSAVPGRKRLSVDLPTILVENIRKAASKHNQTITKYLLKRLNEAIRYEKEIDTLK